MSDNTVEIIENSNILEITSSTESETYVVEIVQSGVVNLEMSTNVALLPSSFEDNTKVTISETLVGDSGIVIGPLTSGNIIISTSGLQPSGDYSLVGHTHNSSDITNFNSSVSGLLPVKNISAGSGIGVTNNSGDFTVSVTGTFGLTGEQVDDRVSNLLKSGSYVNLDYNDSLDSLTISVTGLQPSGNYSLVGHSHDISDINNLQNALDNKQPSGIYASGVHYHISSDITDFNNSVSGLLPVKNISSGSGISVINNSGNFTVAVTGTFGLTSEEVDDRVNDLLIAGSNIVLNYNDLANQLTISTSGLQPSGNYSIVGHSHVSSDITDFNSSVSGILPVTNISSGSYTSISSSSGNFTISVTGVQPSGNYSVVGHSHTSNDITDFSSSVNTLISGIYAPLNSPAFTGVPTVPTAPSGTNDTQIANTSFVRTEISNLVDSAPITLDTLNELAAALGDDPNFATTVTNLIGDKVSKSGDTMSGTLYAPTGVFSSGLTLNGIAVSTSGHTHISSDIIDFSSGVSGLLPVKSVVGSGYAVVSNSSGIYTISTSGLQPSGNYSLVGHTHSTSDITDFNSGVSGLLPVKNILGSGYVNVSSSSGNYTISVSGLQPSGNYSLSGHTHTSSNITDFNSSVSGLLPITSINSGSYINISQSGTTFTVSATGLQPSGNYSVVGHNHTSSDITDFNSSVSGLLPVKDIVAGTGINISSTSGIYTINGLSLEEVQDDLGNNFLIEGNNIDLNYIDASGTLTISTILDPTFNKIQLDLNADPVLTQGQIGWNDTEGTIDIALTDNVAINVGEHSVYRVRNTTGSILYKGQVVYASGVHSNGIIEPNLYVANGSIREIRFIGLVLENINDNNNGYAMNFGHINNIDTRGNVASAFAVGDETWADGDILYVHPTVPGKLTNVEPKHSIASALILDSASNGKIFVRPTSYGHLDDNHDVNTSGVVNGQFLQYDSSTDYWIPSSSGNFTSLQVNSIPVSVSGHFHTASNITDFNSSVSGLLPTNIVTGVGSSGYVSRWNGTNSLTSGVIYDNGTNVGIGTSTPSEALHVIGSGRFSGDVTSLGSVIVGSGTASLPSIEFISDADTGAFSPAANTFAISTSGTERMRITSAGAVGINTTSPNALLHAYSATSGDTVFNVEGTNGSLFSVIDSLSGSLMSVNNNAGLPVFEVFSDDSIIAGRYNQNDFVINSSGNIGIGGAANNSYKLQAIGNVNVSGILSINGFSAKSKTIGTFTASDNQPPATNAATLDTRNSILVLDFDASTDESAVFAGVIPEASNTSSGLMVRLNWAATSATSGTCVWGVQFEDMNSDIDSDSFDTAVLGSGIANATNGIPTVTEITCTTIDSLVAGEFYRIKIYRDADNAGDSMTGDAELISLEVRTIA